jgi:predicted phage baseplate assembly protein
MPLPDIQLDDRTFEQLRTELLRRIPAYTPEWTDQNESDPGVALIELFAWLAEMILYRLNKVPDKNYNAFLQLVGIDLILPRPAKAELTFKLSAKGLAVQVPVGTEVQASGGAGSGPVVFTTDEDIIAVGLSLAQAQVCDGARFTVIPTNPWPAVFAALSKQPQPGAALYLGFDNPFPQLGPHRLTVHAAPPKGEPVAQAGADLTGSSLPPVTGYWEYYGGTAAAWQPLAVLTDTTNCLTQSGVLKFTPPAANAHVATQYGALQRPSDPKLYWIRYRLDQNNGPGYESPPMLQDVLLNTVGATNAVTETDEILGASSGLPNQTFTLANVPVLPRDPSVAGIIAVIEVEQEGYVTWKEVADFTQSGPSDKVYTINLSTGVITFGDGRQGKIPAIYTPGNAAPSAFGAPNIKATLYQWGGGAAANVGASTITTLNSTIPSVDSVTNLRPAAGGQDEETVADASDRAPAVLRTQYRAVTAQDFADLARQTPGTHIVRAYALPLHHPTLSVTRAPGVPGSPTRGPTDVPFPGVVTVLVIPYSTEFKPVPTQATLQLVANYLDTCRLITTEVYVKGPDYRKVEIQVSVIADPRTPLAVVSQALNARLLAYFNPVTGGEEQTGWDFGYPIYTYETLRQILLSTGVVRIVPGTLQTYVDGVLQTADVLLGPSETVYSVSHTITVSYS